MWGKNLFCISISAFFSFCLILFMGPLPAQGATFTVTNLTDNSAVPPVGSLREAVDLANANSDEDTIVFANGLSGTLTLEEELDIEFPLSILGPGADVISITTTDGTFRIFDVELGGGDEVVTIRGLTLTGGGGEGATFDGGAISVELSGTLVVEACVITDNNVKNNGDTVTGGGIFFNESTNGKIFNTEITNNRAEGGGAGISAKEFVNLEIVNSRIEGNNTESFTIPDEFGPAGGLLFHGNNLFIEGSSVSNNSGEDGGGIYIDPSGNELTVIIHDSQINDNNSKDDGGGVLMEGSDLETSSVLINNSEFLRNSAFEGGGGLLVGGAVVTILGSTFADNFAGSDAFPEEGNGGGILFSDTLDIQMVNSTVSGNSANHHGGGIHIDEEVVLALQNVTIFSNRADADGNDMGEGGGINVEEFGQGEAIEEVEITMKNSILAGNEDPNSFPDCAGIIISLGFNLLGNNEGCLFLDSAGDLVGIPGNVLDPLLDPDLTDNGGPTPTHALLDGSPALDAAGGNAGCGVDFDQRGVLRPQGTRCDMGAFEKEVIQPEPPNGGGQEVTGDGCSCKMGSQGQFTTSVGGYLLFLCFALLLAGFRWTRRAR